MGKRIDFIDAIRGLAIILVVMGHAIAWNYPDWKDICMFDPSQPKNHMAGGVVWQIIYSFHMALFFMVSGYLSGTSIIDKKNYWDKIKNKTFRLLIPYFATGYLIYFVRGNWGYWFLLTLYEMSLLWIILFVLLKKLNPTSALWKDILVMALVYGVLRGLSIFSLTAAYIDTNLLKYFIPFCFGCLMKRHRVIENTIKEGKIFTVCLVLFFLLFISRYLTEIPLLYVIIEKLDFFFSISALCACIATFSFFMNGINQKIENLFVYLGKLSMPIYILHNLFLIQIANVGIIILEQSAVTSITIQIVYSLIVSFIAIAMSIFLYHILHRSTLIRLLLFGERN
jgi:fucose 4-O-acetylase-like acetyltransferase